MSAFRPASRKRNFSDRTRFRPRPRSAQGWPPAEPGGAVWPDALVAAWMCEDEACIDCGPPLNGKGA